MMGTGLFSANKRFKERYDGRKKAGLCVRCGKEPADKSLISCKDCNISRNKYFENARKEKKWKAYSKPNGLIK